MFPATSFCFLDYDLDGNLDIYVGTFSANHQSNIWLPGYLLKGNGDGTFRNVTEEKRNRQCVRAHLWSKRHGLE
jgi:hypothetical protein